MTSRTRRRCAAGGTTTGVPRWAQPLWSPAILEQSMLQCLEYLVGASQHGLLWDHAKLVRYRPHVCMMCGGRQPVQHGACAACMFRIRWLCEGLVTQRILGVA